MLSPRLEPASVRGMRKAIGQAFDIVQERTLSPHRVVEWRLNPRGRLAPREAHRELAALVDETSGLVLLPPGLRRPAPRLLVIDMDSTLVRQEGIDELAREVGQHGAVARITERAMRGEIAFDEALRERCRRLAGASAEIFERVRGRLTLTPGAVRLMETWRALGHRAALVSGGFAPLAEPLAGMLGFDRFFANDLEIVHGRLTGEVKGTIVNGVRKGEIVEELRGEFGFAPWQVVAVGDGANDLPMLGRAGLGIAFNAKPAVRRQAPHAVNFPRLDAVLYLLGMSDEEIEALGERRERVGGRQESLPFRN